MMKTIYILLLSGCLLGSCRETDVPAPAFTVSIPRTTYQLGDTVRFAFGGNPENIIFYSGEPGFCYRYKDRSSGEGIPELNFTSYQQNTGETNTLLLLASTDFDGVYDTTHIRNANWLDITDRATLSKGQDRTASGKIDLSDLAAINKPVYLAFKYQGYRHATLKQPTWTIRTLTLNNILPDGKVSPIAALNQMGWAAFDLKNPTVLWSVPSSGQVVINGTATGSVKDDNEDWVISRALDLKGVTPDVSISLKDLGSASLEGYEYIYKKPGNYTITFVAFNNNIDDQKSLVREFDITVNP